MGKHEMSLNRRDFIALAGAASAGLALAPAAPGQEKKKYRACIIGDTKQGGYGHGLHLLWGLRDDVEVVGLSDPDEKGRADHGRDSGAPRLYADYREMLQTEKPDLVAVGPRWPIHHKEYLTACAEIGAHGIIEKPLAVDLAEMDDIIAVMDAKKLRWSIAFNFRASPVVQHARKCIFEDKIIGEVLELRARGKEDPRSGGEDLIVLGIHLFDLMINCAGAPTWCWAQVEKDGHAVTKADIQEATEPLGPIAGDSVEAVYGFPGNITGFFASKKNADGNQGRWGLDVLGTKGVVTFRMASTPAVYMLDDPTWAPGGRPAQWQPLPGAPEVSLPEPVGHYKPIIDDLITAIAENRETDYSFRDARAAHEMIQGVFESVSHSNSKVSLPLQNRTHPLGRWPD